MIEADNLSSIFVDEGFVAGIQTVTPKALMHHAILLRQEMGLGVRVDIAFGGMHYMIGDAERIQETIARRASAHGSDTAASVCRAARIKEIAVGERYKQWVGGLYMEFTHGQNDGFHDSPLFIPAARPFLRGRLIPG